MPAFRPTLLIAPVSAKWTPLPLPLPKKERDEAIEEAALFATLGGEVPLDYFEPPFELRGYRLLEGKGAVVRVLDDNQSASPGDLPKPIKVKIADSTGKGIGGVPVYFEVKEGGGRVDGDGRAEVVTDSTGIAKVVWTIAGGPGTKNQVRVLLHGFFHTFNASTT